MLSDLALKQIAANEFIFQREDGLMELDHGGETGATNFVLPQSLASELLKAREALRESNKALDAWTHTYASEFCDEDEVRRWRKHISENGGTIGFIADRLESNRSCLPEHAEVKDA